MQCGFRVLQLGASSGLPALYGARPNPSLKRSANGSPPGPVRGAGAFSTARAWRATVVSRLACTLGLAFPPPQARHHSLKFSSARSAGQVLSWLAVSIEQSSAPDRAANNLYSQHSTFPCMPRGPASRGFVTLACWAPFSPSRGRACRRPRTSAHLVRRPTTSELCKA